jgi:hypothetical protein
MARIMACPDCYGPVSRSARACPHCGSRFSASILGSIVGVIAFALKAIVVLILLAIITIMVLSIMQSGHPKL